MWSPSAYKTDALPGSPNIPADFFSGAAVRGLLTHAVPYTTVESTANTVDGVQLYFEGGGPVATGMNYYADNVTYPYQEGNPTQSSSTVGSAAWWWTQGTTQGSPFYDPALAACMTTTCVFPMIGEAGATNLDIILTEEINSIESITGNHLQPYTYDLNFGGPNSLISYQLGGEGPGAAPLPYWNLGWAADNFNPQDYLFPMAFPNSTYTYGDAVYQGFNTPADDNPAACGHANVTQADLIYWGKIASSSQIPQECQGVAYDIVDAFFYTATHATNVSEITIDYWAMESILNGLNLYVWDGQQNEIFSAAPWIDLSSVNTNPTVGAGADQYYFQLRYVPFESTVTFQQTGLPSGASWTVSAGTPLTVKSNSTGGPITFALPNGTTPFKISAQAGVVTAVSGGTGTTLTSTQLSGSPVTLSVTFSPVTLLTFTETGLQPNTPWTVTINETGKGAAQLGYFNGTSGTSIVFPVPSGTAWKYTVSAAAGYKFATSGTVKVKGNTEKALKFVELFTPVTFTEKGLKKGTTWSVNISGPGGASYSFSGTGASAKFKLPFGSYTFTVSSVTGYTVSMSSGSFVISSTHAVKEAITYTSTTSRPPGLI